MNKEISLEDAARSLQEVANSRARMRSVIRAHRGHLHLWLWGTIISLQCLGAQFWGVWALGRPSLILIATGIVAAFTIGFMQSRQIRSRPDLRFLTLVGIIFLFHYGIYPQLLGWPHDAQTGYAYGTLIWMLVYILAGVWFDSALLWTGLFVTAAVLVGLWVFPAFFWWWCAFFVGGAIIATGFYVRYFWR